MRRRKLTIGLLSMMMAASVDFGIQGNDVHAASKKLSVNRVYENATRINGKTRKKNIVRVKIGKKTYKAKANKKGKFTVKIPRVAAGKKYTLKSYKGKKLYKTKKVYVIAKKLKINKYTPNSKSISGYTRPSYKVKVKIASKTYVKKASAVTGYWKVKPDNNKKIGTTVSVKVVNTKGKTVTETKKQFTRLCIIMKSVITRLLRFQLGMKLYREDIRFVLFVEEIKRRILLIVLIIKLIHNCQMNILQLMI